MLIHPRKLNIMRGADKSLARPGRKQAAATKLMIYSTYSPMKLNTLLGPLLQLLQATQKKFRRLSVQPGLRSSDHLHVGQKMATFQLFFQFKDLPAPPCIWNHEYFLNTKCTRRNIPEKLESGTACVRVYC